MGPYEFMPNSLLLTLVGQVMCHEQAITVEICANALFIVAGFNSEQLNRVSVQISMQFKAL
jgi:triacylglycerol lipase